MNVTLFKLLRLSSKKLYLLSGPDKQPEELRLLIKLFAQISVGIRNCLSIVCHRPV